MKRPAVEEFVRLTSVPAPFWGMADSDVVDLCNYILELEGKLTAPRRRGEEMIARHSSDEIDCAADALRRFEQGGKNLRMWGELPISTKRKWREKAGIVLDAADRERSRALASTQDGVK